jgi:hypothetical protein
MRLLISTALAATLIVTLPACNRQDAGNATNTAAPATAAAATSLDALNGTWKIVLVSVKAIGKPDEFLLKDGKWTCSTCNPPLEAIADGKFHPVADRPYFDSLKITTVDDKTVEFKRQKGGKDVSDATFKVADDGKSMNVAFNNFANPGSTNKGNQTLDRVGPPVAGAHAVSGQWLLSSRANVNEDALEETYKIDGDTVNYSSQGQSYTATLGGPAAELKGDTGGTTVKVERAEGGGIKETFMRGGAEVGVTTITPGADGKSVNYTSVDPRDGQGSSYMAEKKE